MRALRRFGLAAVAVVAGSCDDGAYGPLSSAAACVGPCVRLTLSTLGTWRGPPLPARQSPTIGAIACMTSAEPSATFPTRFEIDREAQTVDFECDGKDGLHLTGHLTGISNFGASRAEGDFGRDSSLVLSGTGEMAGWLGEVMDPTGTDLWREFEYPPRWQSSTLLGVTSDATTILIDGSKPAEVASHVIIEFELYVSQTAPPP
jgi:hypothetical protein